MPYATDLRERAVRAYNEDRGSYAEVSDLFAIGTATLTRWLRRHRCEDTVEPRPHGGGRVRRIGPIGEVILLALLERQPDLTLEELAAAYGSATHTRVGKSVLDRTLSRLDITLKKRLLYAASGRPIACEPCDRRTTRA
jgi:transposase